jgi:hydroxymethylbilane synthase
MTLLVFATRPSPLARQQTRLVINNLLNFWEDLSCQEFIITTKGDRVIDKPLPEIGGKGLFTLELEQALLSKRVHAAVHSLKDLPTEEINGLKIGVITQRADVRDILFCPAGHTLDELPSNAVIGTSSVRRKAQLLAFRPDLQIKPIRGNVETRIRKVREGHYDAIVLAAAGVLRLELPDVITQYLPLNVSLPSPGQGALAVKCRASDVETLNYLNAVEHPATRKAVTAERVFLDALGGGCSLPVGAYATVEGETISLNAEVVSPNGEKVLRFQGNHFDPYLLGAEVAQQAISKGAKTLLS